jgi:hypothetical protein
MIFSRELKRLRTQSVTVVKARGKILDLIPYFCKLSLLVNGSLFFVILQMFIAAGAPSL